MPIQITMPALSPTMEEGNLAKWLVKEGDSVAPGDVIAEIETDKATMEVEAVDEGTVAKLVVPAGTEGVKVNALIAVLAADGEDVGEAAKAAANGGAAKPAAEKAPSSPPVGEVSAQRTEGGGGDGAPAIVQASPPPPDQPPAAAAHPPHKGEGEASRVFASPLARRLAQEGGIDLSAISGSGPKGRVVKADVEAAAKTGVAKAAAPATGQAPAPVKAP
ncbi:biotin/lipoyl-containing protein, partial [Nitratireductor soli]|uniref:biotin/lipoyl-containing protein n=1 Tax=Nitratireductor soli TaxID=1670619 RepID=UPI00065DDA78